jgi:3-dehydroquinate synthase
MEGLYQRDSSLLAEAIERSCQNKAKIVSADEQEHGVRALLNLGHTFGHAIETGAGYGYYLHGEAVAVGMLMAADLSYRMGWITEGDVERVRKILLAARLPVTVPAQMTIERFLTLMAVDKKVQDGAIRLILLKAIGVAVISDDYDRNELLQTLESFQA